MKKEYIFLQFALVFLFFILPPLLTNQAQVLRPLGTLTWMLAVEVALVVLLEFEHRKFFKEKSAQSKTQLFIHCLSVSTLTLGLLMLAFALSQFLSITFPSLVHQNTEIAFPQTLWQWISVLLVFLVSAVYEEVLYRQFLPFVALLIAGKVKLFQFLAELVAVLVFAFSHRYLGLVAVINAFVCGIILRWCYIKTRSFVPGAIAHFLYNIIVFSFWILSVNT